ncbi:MAG: hypothetical protein FWC43_11475 [Planctomycetaceae bacterium]|nr:hypothetical protein [Planctomycetaceae bacterium]
MTRFTAIDGVCVFFLLLLASSNVTAAQKFPYTAQITEGEAIVYSSPGAERYETQKLKAGDKVEVYQINPDGWCAIRPPIGSFSWICGLYVEAALDNIGTVTVDQLSSRIGSQFGETCKTVQVQLKKGERVVLLERVETPSNTASPVWYKIVPPSGEFRWIHHDSISTFSKTAKTNGGGQIRQVSYEEPFAGSGFEEAEILDSEPMPFAEESFDAAFSELAESDPLEAPNSAMVQRPAPIGVNPRTLPQRPNPIFNPTVHDPRSGVIQQQPDPYQRALAQLNQEIHAAMNRPTEDWMFETMIRKGRMLIERAPTEYDRTRAMQMVQVLERTRNIRKMNAFQREQSSNFSGSKLTQSVLRNNTNPGTVAPVQNTPMLPNLGTVPATNPTVSPANYSTPTAPNTSPFKAVGRLGWFSQRPEGFPPYALVNEQGQIVSYVTPQPDVDLKPYINKHVGIDGTPGVYISGDKRAPHIGAAAVFPIN